MIITHNGRLHSSSRTSLLLSLEISSMSPLGTGNHGNSHVPC